MKYFFVSDLHIDYYAPMSRTVPLLHGCFDKFYEKHFLPADVCCIAGDISNSYFIYLEFLRYISQKYKRVYVCLGNHDIIKECIGTFGVDKEFPTSEEKIEFFQKEVAQIENVFLLENRMVDGIAGCLGMCDFKYRHSPDADVAASKLLWSTRWFDGRHWNYKNNDTEALWDYYRQMMVELTRRKPRIMMTHFLPLEMGMGHQFVHDPSSCFFYFEGQEFLENLDEGSIWQAGHTHTAFKKVYVDSRGRKHLMLCNPVGYPTERPYEENGLRPEDFLIDIEPGSGH